ncbi:hypothetical protein HDU93_008586 [Gonapodya sp. JEL0774]|nr:hypothetical protein HDU93_008586 [Gonapodya sp. JEL0774]
MSTPSVESPLERSLAAPIANDAEAFMNLSHPVAPGANGWDESQDWDISNSSLQIKNSNEMLSCESTESIESNEVHQFKEDQTAPTQLHGHMSRSSTMHSTLSVSKGSHTGADDSASTLLQSQVHSTANLDDKSACFNDPDHPDHLNFPSASLISLLNLLPSDRPSILPDSVDILHVVAKPYEVTLPETLLPNTTLPLTASLAAIATALVLSILFPLLAALHIPIDIQNSPSLQLSIPFLGVAIWAIEAVGGWRLGLAWLFGPGVRSPDSGQAENSYGEDPIMVLSATFDALITYLSRFLPSFTIPASTNGQHNGIPSHFYPNSLASLGGALGVAIVRVLAWAAGFETEGMRWGLVTALAAFVGMVAEYWRWLREMMEVEYVIVQHSFSTEASSHHLMLMSTETSNEITDQTNTSDIQEVVNPSLDFINHADSSDIQRVVNPSVDITNQVDSSDIQLVNPSVDLALPETLLDTPLSHPNDTQPHIRMEIVALDVAEDVLQRCSNDQDATTDSAVHPAPESVSPRYLAEHNEDTVVRSDPVSPDFSTASFASTLSSMSSTLFSQSSTLAHLSTSLTSVMAQNAALTDRVAELVRERSMLKRDVERRNDQIAELVRIVNEMEQAATKVWVEVGEVESGVTCAHNGKVNMKLTAEEWGTHKGCEWQLDPANNVQNRTSSPKPSHPPALLHTNCNAPDTPPRQVAVGKVKTRRPFSIERKFGGGAGVGPRVGRVGLRVGKSD